MPRTPAKHKRVMSDRQRAALAAGRAKRDANRAGTLGGSSSMASGPRRQGPGTISEPGVRAETEQVTLPTPPIDSLTPSSGLSLERQPDADPDAAKSNPTKPRPRTTVADLNLAFMSEDEEASPGEPEGEHKTGLADGLKGIFQSAANLGEQGEREKKSRRVTSHERMEDEVGIAAGEYGPLVAGLFMLLMGQVVGNELRPDYDTANSITLPLLRIMLRHVDPLREISPDAADMLASAGAFSLYAQAVWPYYKQARIDRRANAAREKMRILHASPIPAPANVNTAAGRQHTIYPERKPEPNNTVPTAPESTEQRGGQSESADNGRIQGHAYNTPREPAGNGVTDPTEILREVVGVF